MVRKLNNIKVNSSVLTDELVYQISEEFSIIDNQEYMRMCQKVV